MQLSDREIYAAVENGSLRIAPFGLSMLQPASVDVHLGRDFRTAHGLNYAVAEDSPQILVPNQFLLGQTFEEIELPADIAARVEGKSSLGRRGLMIHVSAGFVDPGFQGRLTLELKNLCTISSIELWPGMPIAQISFHRLGIPASRPYGHPDLNSHYQGQQLPRGAHPDTIVRGPVSR